MARRSALLFCLLCAAWYFHETVWNVVPQLSHPSDFTLYYQAAQNVLAGRSPFVTEGYIYPPLLACLLTPLATLSYVAARWVWFIFSQLCLIAAALLTWKHMGRDWAAACSIAFVWALGGAAVESLALGQLGPLLALLLAIAYTQRGWRSAAAAGFGLALKFIPGVLAAALVLRRDWRRLADPRRRCLSSARASLVLYRLLSRRSQNTRRNRHLDRHARDDELVAALGGACGFWTRPRPEPPRCLATGKQATICPICVCPRTADGSHSESLSPRCSPASPCSRSQQRAASRTQQTPFAMAALISLSLAAAPVCWTHYQVMQYPGVALLLGYALQ